VCIAFGTASPALGADPGAPEPSNVVVTTEILEDLMRNVGGDRIEVTSVVPHGGDPHSYEPKASDAVTVTGADAVFSNHLLLEEHAMIKLLDANAPAGAPNVDLAEQAERYGARLRPLVEDAALDTVWLGLAVRGEGPNRSADVRLSATALRGPGELFVYVTEALGRPEVYWNSRDGFDANDVAVLPPGAHTHLNWAFTEPGVYELDLSATLDAGDGAPRPVGAATFTFAVGVDPREAARPGAMIVVDDGHADVSVSLETGELFVCTAQLSCAEQRGDVPAGDAVIEVPNRAVTLVPKDRRFRFLGKPRTKVWELPQAVLGKHVHGEIDPHLWQDVSNAQAYVRVMADVLVGIDPAGRVTYEQNRDRYLTELERLDQFVARRIDKISKRHRELVTTHDAFGYLANAYGMDVAGFVVPNPAQEPSAVQVTRLVETIRNLDVPAVFLEPNLAARASVLRQVAKDEGVRICKIYGDSFDRHVRTYVQMMRHNADELFRCLGGNR